MDEQYTSYTVIELAADPAFIRWVQTGQVDTPLKMWMESDPGAHLKSKEARQIVQDLSKSKYVLKDADKIAMWEKIASQTSSGNAATSGHRFRIISKWTIAAAAAIALLFWFTTRNSSSTIYAQAGEHQDITLPENSQVHINAGSSVSYHKKQFSEDRTIRLEGEAFFSVQPGSKFTVVTEQGTVTVLGTSFNVIARKNRFEVSCYTGKVMVENKSASQQTLIPGNLCISNPETKTLDLFSFSPVSGTPEWAMGKFVFNNQPLHIVIEELERQYNISVRLEPGLENMAYTGLFETGDLEKALSLITWPLHLKADIKNNTVSIVR